jgi:Zn-dependent M28 family amino/carboxypeptidase
MRLVRIPSRSEAGSMSKFGSSVAVAMVFAVVFAGCVFVVPDHEYDENLTHFDGTGSHSRSVTSNRPASQPISAERILEHTRELASDEYEGRAPGTRGEDLTVEYLVRTFRELGLQPGNPDSTFVQRVPLVGFKANSRVTLHVAGRTQPLEMPKECVAITRRQVANVEVERSPLVFVGYGIVAPEYGWDDYKGVDVRGKTIVMLVNDPGSAEPVDAESFKGRAMTYYGRWTYKYEIAAEKGAAAALIVHQTGPAGYPWEVVSQSFGRENFDIETPDQNVGRAAIEGWLTLDAARRLFADAGQDFDALARAAQHRDFQAQALDAQASFQVTNTLRPVASQNVIARLPGSDPELRDEYVIYSAHWDHLGRNDALQGDPIFNGAVDNASGTAALLMLAEAFAKLPVAPKRSMLFLAVTAEEKGLLGSRYYTRHPLYPLNKTLANVNMDGLNVWGRTSDIVNVGHGMSTLDDVLIEAAAAQSRSVTRDPDPEKGLYYRSDHFEFAKQGVPALYADGGSSFIGRDPDYGRMRREEYVDRDYHKPSDEVREDWDLSGAVEDVRLLFQIGLRVSDAPRFPEWRADAEFKAKRDSQLGAGN